MRKLLCLGLLMGLLATSLIAIVGCGEDACQPIGSYEECLQRGNAICVDIYPKCPEHGKIVQTGTMWSIECKGWEDDQKCEAVGIAYNRFEDGYTVKAEPTRTLLP